MTEETPRFEFRVFGDDLGAVAERLPAVAHPAPGGEQESDEIYLLRRGSVPKGRNVKIRDGAVEVKRLLARRGALERWQPAGRFALPLAAEVVRGRVLPALGVDAAALGTLPPRVSLEALIARLDAAGVEAIGVHKHRRTFEGDALAAEHTRIDVAGGTVESVAIESADADAVAAARRALGLENGDNVSYASWLRRRRSGRGARGGSGTTRDEAYEIERKFLVRGDAWRAQVESSTPMRQGYLSLDPERTVRVRLAGDRGTITVKGRSRGAGRLEWEWEVSADEARELLDTLCVRPLVAKTRHRVRHGGLCWEVDEFAGGNRGLVVTEVELDREDRQIALPPWAGAEVTGDARYSNASLVRAPFAEW